VTPEFDHVGPLARSVADAACALTVLSGWDPGRADGEDFGAALTQNLKGLRLGVPTNPEFFLGTEGALALFEGARRALVARGLVEVDFAAVQVLEATDLLHDVVMPPHVRAHHIAAYGGLSAHGRPFREWAGRADTITAEAYLAARARIDRLTEEWRGHFARFDVALLPGNLHGALPHGQTTITIGGASHPMRRVLSKFNALANMTGCPSLLVPVGTDRGMPISVQIVGPPFADGRVLAVGKALEETFGTVAALGIEPIPAPPAGGA
jgi:aspartyl-tRNA(Asn)/glutamyl-tRNA(Gln) amidotransferase subunit A